MADNGVCDGVVAAGPSLLGCEVEHVVCVAESSACGDTRWRRIATGGMCGQVESEPLECM
jgi:hypothetical protein